MTARSAVAAIVWVALFALPWYFPAVSGFAFRGSVSLICSATATVVAGYLIGSWWALLLPLLALPAVALPSSYTPGAAPEYGVGVYFAGIFLVVAVALLGAGVVAARWRLA